MLVWISQFLSNLQHKLVVYLNEYIEINKNKYF